MRYLFQVVQTQTTTAYCRILPTLDHHVSGPLTTRPLHILKRMNVLILITAVQTDHITLYVNLTPDISYINRHYTCENGDYICTRYLLKQREVDLHAKDRYGATALSEAVRKHREDIIVLLLEHGASWLLDGVGEILCSYVGR